MIFGYANETSRTFHVMIENSTQDWRQLDLNNMPLFRNIWLL